jgi:hypothetical protein
LIAASVWMASSTVPSCVWICLWSAEMMPSETVGSEAFKASALPMAIAASPTSIESESPRGRGTRSVVSDTSRTARSCRGAADTTVAGRALPSLAVTVTFDAFSMTW